MDKVEIKTRNTNGELVNISVIVDKVLRDFEIKYQENINSRRGEIKK